MLLQTVQQGIQKSLKKKHHSAPTAVFTDGFKQTQKERTNRSLEAWPCGPSPDSELLSHGPQHQAEFEEDSTRLLSFSMCSSELRCLLATWQSLCLVSGWPHVPPQKTTCEDHFQGLHITLALCSSPVLHLGLASILADLKFSATTGKPPKSKDAA